MKTIAEIVDENEKGGKNRNLTLQERWAMDCESYKDPNYNVETGKSQCYKCGNRIKDSVLKCSKFQNVSKEILFNVKECEFRIEKEED